MKYVNYKSTKTPTEVTAKKYAPQREIRFAAGIAKIIDAELIALSSQTFSTPNYTYTFCMN